MLEWFTGVSIKQTSLKWNKSSRRKKNGKTQAREKGQHSSRHVKLDEGSILKTDTAKLNQMQPSHRTNQWWDFSERRGQLPQSLPISFLLEKEYPIMLVFPFHPLQFLLLNKEENVNSPDRRNTQIDREVMGQFLSQSSIFFLIYTRSEIWLSNLCLRKLQELCHVLLLGTLSNLGTSSAAKLDSLSKGTATEYFFVGGVAFNVSG